MKAKRTTRWILADLALALALVLVVGLSFVQTAQGSPEEAVGGRAGTLGACMHDDCGVSSPCTASDTGISRLDSYLVTDPCSLVPGDTGEYYFQATIVSTSNQRYDPGFWIATDGDNAKTGVCYHDYLAPPLQTTGLTPPITGPYWDTENNGDQCGDVKQNQINTRIVGPVVLTCTAAVMDGAIDSCIAWDNNQDNNCPANKNCPGTGSKCRCAPVPVEINKNIVPLKLTKDVSTDALNPGETFVYTITVTNMSAYTSTGSTVTDTLISNLKFISSVPAPTTIGQNPPLPLDYGVDLTWARQADLAAGASYQIVLTMMLDPNYVGPGTRFPNRACVFGFDYEAPETLVDNCDDVSVPTSVDFLEAPSVFVGGDYVTVSWVTGPDMASSAFSLFRSEARDGSGKVLLESGPLGSYYEFTDNTVERGRTYYYFIEVFGSDGAQPMIVLQAETYYLFNIRLPIVRR